jgi:hypothetical protein
MSLRPYRAYTVYTALYKVLYISLQRLIIALALRFYRFHRRFHVKDEQNGINL